MRAQRRLIESHLSDLLVSRREDRFAAFGHLAETIKLELELACDFGVVCPEATNATEARGLTAELKLPGGAVATGELHLIHADLLNLRPGVMIGGSSLG